MVRSRYAPSPTGFMHIGNLRTALYEYLIAKKDGGVFALRIEDTDGERYVEGAEDVIYYVLQTTGLVFDEGPGVGGAYGPYVQSQRKASYMVYAKDLMELGKAYYCFCTKERLDSLSDARGLKKYDRHCYRLGKEEIALNIANGLPYVVRQYIPEGKTAFRDEVYGEITIENTEIEDQILVKSDGMPTYNFANVVDDHDMAITHVVRGSEYLTSTPKYKLLYEAFGWDVPLFVHLPLLLNSSGKKISKRHNDASVTDLLKMGFLPSAIVNYAALLGWSHGGTEEIFSLPELVQAFDIKKISKAPSVFDMKKFTWMNGEHIKRLPMETYFEMALPILSKAVKTEGIDYAELARITQSRVSFVHECGEMLDFIDDLPEYSIELYTHKKMKTNPEVAHKSLKLVVEGFERLQGWNHEILSEQIGQSAEEHGLSKGQILWPIRTATSGKPTTPCGAVEICLILGRDETIKRLNKGISMLELQVNKCTLRANNTNKNKFFSA